MVKLKEVLNVWKTVFSRLRYIIFLIAGFLIFYLLNVFLININNIKSVYGALDFSGFMTFLLSLILEFKNTVIFSSFVSVVIVGILFGFLFSLIMFKINSNIAKSSSGFIGGLGVFLGVLAPGCAACGIGVVSALGLSAGFLSVFPYEGLELSFLAMVILAFAIFKTSKDLTRCDICKINLEDIHNMKGGKK